MPLYSIIRKRVFVIRNLPLRIITPNVVGLCAYPSSSPINFEVST